MSESNTRAEIVEVMARGACRAACSKPACDCTGWLLHQAECEAALTALEASGRAVVDTRAPVFAFLMGEGLLDGRGFGDDPPIINGRKHPYWWRTNLRAALPPPARRE